MIAGFVTTLKWSDRLSAVAIWGLSAAIVCLLFAAVCGATLASSVIDVYGNYGVWNEAGANGFWRKKIGPFKWKWYTPKVWWALGHGAFWLAVSLFVATFFIQTMCWAGKLRAPCQQFEPRLTPTTNQSEPVNPAPK
jgi:hypothetical protein